MNSNSFHGFMEIIIIWRRNSPAWLKNLTRTKFRQSNFHCFSLIQITYRYQPKHNPNLQLELIVSDIQLIQPLNSCNRPRWITCASSSWNKICRQNQFMGWSSSFKSYLHLRYRSDNAFSFSNKSYPWIKLCYLFKQSSERYTTS